VAAGSACNNKGIKEFGGDNRVCEFSISLGKDADGNRQYVTIKAWRMLAEVAASIKQGEPVFVVGRHEERDYNGKTYKAIVADYIGVTRVGAAQDGFQQVNDPGLPDGFKDDGGELPY
jgi:single-stranded DNA-binding protein